MDAQRSVERFFSQRMIVPSPWTQDKAPTKHVTFSPHPPDTAYFREESFNESCNGKMVDASCQTCITVPLNWDLEAMLGADCAYHDDDERRVKDCGNTSLRRKLFGQPQRLSPNEDEATASTPCQSTPPISNDVTSPVTALATGPLLRDNMAATPNIILTTSPSPSSANHRSSFPVDHSPYHCMSPILTAAPAAADSPPDGDNKGIVSPKLSPINAKSFVTPDGMATPNVHPSSGKSTSTPVLKGVQPMAAVEDDDNHGNNCSQSNSGTDSSGDHTPELLSLEDLRTNTYDFTGIDMAMPSSSISDHDNPAVTMETTEGKTITTQPSTTNITTTTTTSKCVTTSTISHSAGVKSVTDSGIAGSSVEISTQLRDDFSNHLHGSCNVSEQLNIKRCNSKMPSTISATLSHDNVVAKSNSGEHYKENYCSAGDSGLGYNLKATNHAHNANESISHLPAGVDYHSVPVSWSSSTVDSSGSTNSLRNGFSGLVLPAKYQPPVEESTPKSRHGIPAYSHTNNKNRWAWLPRYTSTNGESFSSFAEGVLLRKEMLKSQLQFGPISSLCDCSNISPAIAAQHSFSRYSGLEYSSSYPPTTPLSSRTTGPMTTAPVRYRSPLSDKAFSKSHSKMNRLHLGSFRSRFNKFTLDSGSATPVSVNDRLSHTHSDRLWSSTERYNDWKRSMDRWEHAIRTQYATVDT